MSQSDQFAYEASEAVDREAELDMSRLKYLSREGVRAEPDATELIYPDFTYRHYWGDLQGLMRLNLTGSVIRKTTNVFASITEADPIVSTTDPFPTPFLGAAVMAVSNISPYNGGVRILVSVNWNAPLYTVVSYLFVNP